MTVALRASASAYQTSGTTVTVTIPASTAAGDLLIAQVLETGNGNPVPSTSDTSVSSLIRWQQMRATASNGSLWQMFATATDASASLTFALGTTTAAEILLAVISGWSSVRTIATKSGSLPTGQNTGNTAFAQAGDLGVYLGQTLAHASAPTWTLGSSAVSRVDALMGAALYTESVGSAAVRNPTLSDSAGSNFKALDVVIVTPGPNTGRILKGRTTSTLDDLAGA